MDRMTRLSRMPIRIRLTLAFTLAMALVLAIGGVSLYFGLAKALDQSIDEGLRARADDIATLVRQADSALSQSGPEQLAEQGETFAQVLDKTGRIVDTTPQAGTAPVLRPSEIDRAFAGGMTTERDAPSGFKGRFRLLATPVDAQDARLVVVVGSSLEGRQEALDRLFLELLVGGPLALLMTSLLGYALASAALRPVESMRREAAVISAAEPGRRLPVPIARDEIARLSETLNEMLARLESAFSRERSFVSDASHELRTPLSLLKAELDLALSRPRPNEELERALRSAAVETDRLAQLAADLLVLARVDQDRLPLRVSTIPLHLILDDVQERFARRASDLGRSVMVEAPDDLALAVDRLRLEQALINLVENALRHGAGTVVLKAIRTPGAVEVHVLDAGPGFPAAFLPRAFERFSRSDASRSGGGAGLGLSIVDVIARAHGGSAYAANVPTGGADVWLRLPNRERSVPPTARIG